MADVTLKIDHRGAVAVLTLARPEASNALDAALVAELTVAFEEQARDPAVRAVLLQAEGRTFCAGADIAGMRAMSQATESETLEDARRLARLMRAIDLCPKPTIVRVQGASFGGGLGLIACCDIAIAEDDALFCASEVRLGLIPAVIGPYLLRAAGPRAARRLIVSAERIHAEEALRLGLVHVVTPANALDAAVELRLAATLEGGPEAIAASKRLLAWLTPIDDDIIEETARRNAAVRIGAEAREGFAAFLEKRKPGWRP